MGFTTGLYYVGETSIVEVLIVHLIVLFGS